MTTDALDEFPRQYARTRGFTLGAPRAFTISPDGERVVFLRTRAGDDPVTCVWIFDVGSASERVVFDPRTAAGEEDDRELSDAERARRERTRERAGGVTAYATDREVRKAVFSLQGRLFLANLLEGGARELSVPGPVDDPRLDPAGDRIAYVIDGALHVRDIEGGDSLVASDDDPAVSWGLAEFAAAEEMSRYRGYWWSPGGSKLVVARVDERPVRIWHIVDQTDPANAPRAVRFPQAGTDDAIVTLHVFDLTDGSRLDVRWDLEAFPYLGRVVWTESGPPLILVVSRDQRKSQLLEIELKMGTTRQVRETYDPEWIDLLPDVPARMADGRVVEIVADRDADTNRLAIDGEPVTPPGLQVRRLLHADETVLFRASDEPTEIHLWRWSDSTGATRLTQTPGVYGGTEEGEVTVVASETPEEPIAKTSVLRRDVEVGAIESLAERSVIGPKPRFLSLGERELRAALFLPNGVEPDHPLPVLMDPYGGPHGARVLKAGGAHLTSQWFADNGFAVLVVDNRGVDGRGPVWDRAMKFDFTVSLEDQVDALHAATERFPFLDRSRVGIRGWSFGGELSAMAILRRPDVFHAAVIGAPVTDQRLYDTFYTERYLGHPAEHPEVYERNSPLFEAASLSRPVLLIHGLADDNVYVAHTLRFSAALFEAGKPHELVLIPNATHLTRSEAVTENLLRVQLDFLRRHLDGPASPIAN